VCTLITTIVLCVITLLGAMIFQFRAPGGGMGITMFVGALILSFASCAFLCCVKGNMGRTVMLVGVVVAMLLAIIGIALIGMDSQICEEMTCYTDNINSCDPCKDDAECKKDAADGLFVTKYDGSANKSIRCSVKKHAQTCQTVKYGYQDGDDDKDGFWGFTNKDDCKDWAYDTDVVAFGWLLMFISFPVLLVTACITAGLAFMTPIVDDDKTPAAGSAA